MDVFKNEYWSVAETMILPLTGLASSTQYPVNAYMFWKEHRVDDFELTLVYDSDSEGLDKYLREKVYPILDKKSYLIESHDILGRSIFVLNMAEWALDIQMCLEGKYSKLSKEAKSLIERYHRCDRDKIPRYIWVALYPDKITTLFNNKTAIEYCAEEYGLDFELLKSVGELGIKYDSFKETLLTDIEELVS